MRSKSLTLVFVASLGLVGWLCPVNGTRGADGEPTSADVGGNAVRRRALELMRQATIELQANRFDSARRLARQAAELNATYSLFDVRPEHVLAEIERKESNAASIASGTPGTAQQTVTAPKTVTGLVSAAAAEPANPFAPSKSGAAVTAASLPAPQQAPVAIVQAPVQPQPHVLPDQTQAPTDELKTRAIEILDHGLQALDEHRLDDAERYARAALALHVSFGKLEYKPEYLITEVGIARAKRRLDAATALTSGNSQPAPVTSTAAPQQSPAAPAAQYSRPTQYSQQTQYSQVGAPVAARPVQTAVSQTPAASPSSPASTVAQAYASAQSAGNAPGATSGRDRAERLLQEALSDLHEGRDELARARIEGALGVIHPSTPRPLTAFQVASPTGVTSTGAMVQPVPQADLPQPGMPRAGFPAYVPDPTRDQRDVVLKPLHDPYLGDDANSTQKSSAGEKSLRESLPDFTPLNSTLTLNRPLPRMNDELPQQPLVAQPAVAPVPVATPITRTQAVADDNQAAKVRWPESQPAPSSQSTDALAAAPAVQSAPAARVVQPVPPATPPKVFAPVTINNWAPSSSDDQKPGFFRRIWSAITGE